MVPSQVSKSYTMEQYISVYIVTIFAWKSVTHTHTHHRAGYKAGV